ncbi:MAG: YifB family Mg chelatase-like AAA ATPase [Clostridiales bacterium]|nr:YifB family Mg chelatase-like AAA ATPase [Clostridiales bacterium]
MFSKVNSGGLKGVEGYRIEVEADVSDGLPSFSMVGYLAAEVKEAGDRVRTAIKNSGFHLYPRKVTINLSPDDIRKDGTAFDLPIALAILGAYGIVDMSRYHDSAFLGELGLDGRIKGIRGVLPLALALQNEGIRQIFVPEDNLAESLAAERVSTVRAVSLQEVAALLNAPDAITPESGDAFLREKEESNCYIQDFSEVNGQSAVRRATEVAVAGRHNILYIGPPGSGKTMMASRIPTIMPSLSREEQIELSKIYSVCGMLPPGRTLIRNRPFRAPHHTISPSALIGGGKTPRPGEVSLASRGVLFLDELPEFQRQTLEILRQPLEERKVTIARVNATCDFPADFMLAAAANPCPCGHFPNREKCSCSELQIRRYLGKISRPLLDRIDICVEAAPITYQDIRSEGQNEPSEKIRARVEAARRIQKARFAGSAIFFNSEMGNREVKRYCMLGKDEDAYLKNVFTKMQLSARGYSRILKVARTIADLDGSTDIRRRHLAEAVGYRDLEDRYWGGKA